jgi:hypothetical protein
MKKKFQPIREAHITVDTSKLPLETIAREIADQISNMKRVRK